jgi:uncharacterized protein (TIGR03663 family)
MLKRPFLIPALILLLAAGMRLAFLDLKPPHFDEGINGWFCDQMAKNGYYSYDPNNYHGPLHFYVLFGSLMSLGRNLWALRLPVVLVSLLTVFWIFLFRPFLNRTICYLAALAMAISPGFIFYNRYSIHESWLVLFLVVTYWGFLGIWTSKEPKYFWGSILGVTGMILTKETYIIHLFAFLCAAIGLPVLNKAFPSSLELGRGKAKLSVGHILGAVATGLALIVFFYSGNFRHWEGLADLFKTFLPWTKTGMEAAGHGKPDFDIAPLVSPPFLAHLPLLGASGSLKLNWYWVRLFLDYEWFALFGLAFSFRLIFGGHSALRFLGIYALVVLLIYSVVPYKTPWCVISIAWPFLFLGAAFLSFIANRISRLTAVIVALPLFGHAAWKAYDLNFVRFDNPKERYVYVQTFRDYRHLADPVLEKLAKDRQARTELKGLVFLSSYFPIPWVLGDVVDIGYYGSDQSKWPKDLDADFIVLDEAKADEFEKNLKVPYFVEDFRLRDGMEESRVYFKYDTFRDIFPGRKADFAPGQPSEE